MAKILVVEDDESLRTLLEVNLGARRHTVLAVPDGKSAIEAFRAFLPDGVLLDIVLPDMLGWDVCRILRGYTGSPAMPIVLMSAIYNKLEFRVDAQKAGATDIVAKPFNINEFAAYLEKLLAAAAPAHKAGQDKAPAGPADLAPGHGTEKRVVVFYPDGSVAKGTTTALNPGGAGFNLKLQGNAGNRYISYPAVARVEVVEEF
jgi:two-component system, OmpR family, phosphate regulon response regulator PhoB